MQRIKKNTGGKEAKERNKEKKRRGKEEKKERQGYPRQGSSIYDLLSLYGHHMGYWWIYDMGDEWTGRKGGFYLLRSHEGS